MSQIHHGGKLDAAIAEFGGVWEDWLDLSTGINPNAYPIPELDDKDWQRLPDEALEHSLNFAALRYYSVPQNHKLIAANGTQAIIQALPLVLHHQKVAIVSPTYEEHINCWEKHGRETISCASLEEACKVSDLVICVNPNNPTGQIYQASQLHEAAKTLAEKQGVLVVDEAFGDVYPEVSIVPEQADNVITLRSFGKFFGLAGVRLGFAICNLRISNALSARLGPWNVSGPALRIGVQAFGDAGWIKKSRNEIIQHCDAQKEVLEVCGLKLIGSAGLFMEFEHPDAKRLHHALQQEHILVRSFPLRENRLRFGLCKDMEALERLALTLKKLV